MAKRKVYLGSKNFFTMTVLSVAALFTIFMANSFLQQQTSTQSEASCRATPYFDYNGVVDESYTNVTYKFRVYSTTSNCKTVKYIIYYEKPNNNWKVELKKNLNSWSTYKYVLGSLSRGDGDTIKMRVTAPSGATPGKTYKLPVFACKQIVVDSIVGPDVYNCVQRNVYYKVSERPYNY